MKTISRVIGRSICCRWILIVAVLLLNSQWALAQTGSWVTAWGSSQHVLGNAELSNVTVRMIARITSPGDAVRIRLDNTLGTDPLVVDSAYVGQHRSDATLIPGTNRQVSFNGAGSVTIPPGGSVRSDPVAMPVRAYQDLAVSLYLPGDGIRASMHAGARVTSYLGSNGSGNQAAEENGDGFTDTTVSMLWLKSIDVLSEESQGAIVMFGDSITDGSCTTVDGHDRWEDWLGFRLNEDAGQDGRPYTAIVNEGIGGNTVTGDTLQPSPDSTPGIQRLERDVLSHSGVTHVVLFMGTNDIRREASAEVLIAGMQNIIERVHSAGLPIIGATIIPRHNRAPVNDNTGWDPAKTTIRNEVNEWIRNSATFDGVLDFDRVVQDSDPDRILPAFDCDGIHPNVLGYYEMGRYIPLEIFR
ncbi:MAG: GDSL-type esterase/lipase family protein [Gammaproteobacteria bacterium]|nr:SGNH/GDSL hydrolase family protein [Pseudomonadales bacterium]